MKTRKMKQRKKRADGLVADCVKLINSIEQNRVLTFALV